MILSGLVALALLSDHKTKHHKAASVASVVDMIVNSPNCDLRPEGVTVDTIVLHHTTIPTLEETVAWFLDPGNKVSSHYVIGRDGSVVQMVPLDHRAWHAGKSLDPYGRQAVNDFSVGIEMVNTGFGDQEYPKDQLDALDHVIDAVVKKYPIKVIVSHEFIAEPQGRKDDPKAFPWKRLEKHGLAVFYGRKPIPFVPVAPVVEGK